MKNNILQTKSFDFAIKIINLYKTLIENKKEYVISKQLLRSGISIGANIEEAIGAQSKNDFISKITIAYKEARESHYWIKLLEATNYISSSQSLSLQDELNEILKIAAKIQITPKE